MEIQVAEVEAQVAHIVAHPGHVVRQAAEAVAQAAVVVVQIGEVVELAWELHGEVAPEPQGRAAKGQQKAPLARDFTSFIPLLFYWRGTPSVRGC